MIDLESFLFTVLSSVGFSALLTAGGLWLARTWISARLREGIKHEYDASLAALNAELRRTGDAQLASLKATIDQQAEKLRIAAVSFTEVQKASITRKLEAVDAMWSVILATRASMPSSVSYMDILTTDEYRSVMDTPSFREQSQDLNNDVVMQFGATAFGDLEKHRPFTGEYTWALFTTYHSLLMRLVLLIFLGKSDPEKMNWHKDTVVRRLIASGLGAAGLAEFDTMPVMRIGWMRDKFERLILQAMNKLITGKEFSQSALDQAVAMEEQIRLASPSVRRPEPDAER